MHKAGADCRHRAAGVKHVRAARRVEVELRHRIRVVQHAVHVFVHRKALLGVFDGRGQDLRKGFAAVGCEQAEARIHHAGHGERQVRLRPWPGGDLVQPAAPKRLNGSQPGRHALTAYRRQLPAGSVEKHADPLGGQGVGGGRLDDRRRQAGGHSAVESVAAGQQLAHRRHGGQIVAGGHDTVAAANHRPAGAVINLGVLALVVNRH